MRKLCKIVILGVLLIGFGSGPASAYLVDTGPGPYAVGSALQGGDYFQFLAGQFTLNAAATIRSIEGWMGIPDAGTLRVAIYTNVNDLPGTLLFSQDFSVNEDPYPYYEYCAWHGALNLDWAMGTGTYWVAFETPSSGYAYASMPTPLGTPLANYAKWGENNTFYVGTTAEFAVRIGDTPAVPLPGAVWLLGSGLMGLGAWRRFRG